MEVRTILMQYGKHEFEVSFFGSEIMLSWPMFKEF
jgi:hypothetical protein